MQLDFENKTPIDRAIERLQQNEPPEGYYLAFSGGKDSVVILALAKQAGVKFDAHYNLTTVDPPELVQFVRKQHPEVAIDRPPHTMWQMIAKKGLPRRNARWCCELFKETGGLGRVVVTGIRAEESVKRSRRTILEECRTQDKVFLHPIKDWATSDIWEYIHTNSLPYCSLYDEGFKRIGCVLCPFHRDTELEIQRWPKIALAWERAAIRYYDDRKITKPEVVKRWKSGEEFFRWWLDRDAQKILEEQCSMFVDGEE